MPSIANSRCPSPSGMAAQSSPSSTRASPQGPRTPQASLSLARRMSFFCARPIDSRRPRTSSRSVIRGGFRSPGDVGVFARRVVTQVGLHLRVRFAVGLELLDGVPVQTLEEGHVRRLDDGPKLATPPRVRRRHRFHDERASDVARATARHVDAETAPVPDAGRWLVDANDADDFAVGAGSNRDDRHRELVPLVLVVALEEALLVAKDGAPQRAVSTELPRLARHAADDWRPRTVHGSRAHDDVSSYAERAEQAPHFEQPALVPSADMPAARIERPTSR